MIRSSISRLLMVISPLTRSFHVTSPSGGLQKRTTGGTPSGTGGSTLPGAGRQRRSYSVFSPRARWASRISSSSAGVQ
ncbi:hypothetical protein D3C84_931370 [compost metagenome]